MWDFADSLDIIFFCMSDIITYMYSICHVADNPDLIFVTNNTNIISGEKCGEFSAFNIWQLWGNQKKKFHMTDVEKSEILHI